MCFDGNMVVMADDNENYGGTDGGRRRQHGGATINGWRGGTKMLVEVDVVLQ